MKVMKKKKSHIWVPVCGGIIVICVLAVVVLPQNAGDTGDKGDSAVASEERGAFAEEIEQYISPVDYHYSQKQTSYEQDILEKRNDIVGHYRIGEHFSVNME